MLISTSITEHFCVHYLPCYASMATQSSTTYSTIIRQSMQVLPRACRLPKAMPYVILLNCHRYYSVYFYWPYNLSYVLDHTVGPGLSTLRRLNNTLHIM